MIDEIEITDQTDREVLLGYIGDLKEEITRLEAEIKEQQQEIEDLSLSSEQQTRLEEAANLMADLGRIHNTPKAKADWTAGL